MCLAQNRKGQKWKESWKYNQYFVFVIAKENNITVICPLSADGECYPPKNPRQI